MNAFRLARTILTSALMLPASCSQRSYSAPRGLEDAERLTARTGLPARDRATGAYLQSLEVDVTIQNIADHFECRYWWSHDCDASVSIHCSDKGRAHFAGTLDWISGQLWFAVLKVHGRAYGTYGKQDRSEQLRTRRFVYTLTPAVIDPRTNVPLFAPGAVPVAASIVTVEGYELLVSHETLDRNELLLATKAIAELAIVGAARFRPDFGGRCSRPLP